MAFRGCGLVRLVAVLGYASALLFGQDEASLRQALEGKDAVVKLDMPADSSGVDLYANQDASVDYRKVGNGIKKYGTALRKGDATTITKVHLKNKLIEVQLGGGGYGTFADKMSEPSTPTTFIDKTDRERDLERDLKQEPSGRRRNQMESELGDLRSRRDREEARLRMQAADLQAAQQPIIAEHRLRAGSRFNIRFAGVVPSSMATPDAVLSMLAPYLSVGQGADPAPVDSAAAGEGTPVSPGAQGGNALSLRKGMSETEVTTLFGKPLNRDSKDVAGMNVIDATYASPDATIAAQFVNGVLTKYTVTGR